MIKVFFTIWFLLIANLSNAQLKNNSDSEEKLVREFLLTSEYKLLLNYSSNIKYFLSTATGNLKYGPGGMITYIHEAIHIFDNIKSSGMGNSLYFWNDSGNLLKVNKVNGYVASESIFNLLPSEIKNSSITKTYIICKDNCISNLQGIYGILEEFNALAEHTKSLTLMYNYFDTCNYTNTKEFWDGFLKSANDSKKNFYYFNIYFAIYLKYCHLNHPEFYQRVITNASFKEAFSKVYSKFNNALLYLECISEKIINNSTKSNKNIYFYPSQTEYDIVKKISDNEELKKYISFILIK